MVVDRLTGDFWGFPAAATAPYPIDATSSVPGVSKPIYVGKFDFAAMRK